MLKPEVSKILEEATKRQYKIHTTAEVNYAEPPFGDFSSNIALIVGKKLGKPPKEVASKIAESIQHELIKKIDVAGPGFINIEFSDAYWANHLAEVESGYIFVQAALPEKVQVEFISANPTGPLTLGNARGGFVGDVVANVLTAQGHKVTREYYFNDSGKQVMDLVASVKAAAENKPLPRDSYQGAYIDELTPIYLKNKARTRAQIADALTEYIWQHMIAPAVKKMNIKIDVRTNEQDLTTTQEAIKRLIKRDLLSNLDNKIWLQSKKLGDNRDRALFREDGEPTYLANDIVYHHQVFSERKFERAIKVWGSDHSGQVQSLKLVVKEMLPDKKLDFIILQWVRLIKDGKEIKISKRAGNYITVEEVLEDIPSDVMRWFFLSRAAGTRIDFDYDLAREESQKNPFYYVMYAYVRAHSLLETAKKSHLEPAKRISILSPVEKSMVKQMCSLPELVQEVAESFALQQLTNYGSSLARSFHEYYEQERIIDLPKAEATQKLLVVKAFKVTMGEFFRLLGITPITKM